MPKVTLRNDYHNRTANVIVQKVRDDCGVLFIDLTHHQVTTARKKLCPWPKCQCSSSPTGITGVQTYNDRTLIVLCPDQNSK